MSLSRWRIFQWLDVNDAFDFRRRVCMAWGGLGLEWVWGQANYKPSCEKSCVSLWQKKGPGNPVFSILSSLPDAV